MYNIVALAWAVAISVVLLLSGVASIYSRGIAATTTAIPMGALIMSD